MEQTTTQHGRRNVEESLTVALASVRQVRLRCRQLAAADVPWPAFPGGGSVFEALDRTEASLLELRKMLRAGPCPRSAGACADAACRMVAALSGLALIELQSMPEARPRNG